MTKPHDKQITQDYLKSVLDYNPVTGVFVWKESRGVIVEGNIAGYAKGNGYINIMIDYKAYGAHRLAVLYMTGALPEAEVDHINQVKCDNRWDNLRTCTASQNHANIRPPSDNTSGYKGVCWHIRAKKWYSRIKINKKLIHLGSYSCKHEAARVYNKAAKEGYGEFACLNVIKK